MAVANYHDANGHYPPAYVVGPDGRPWHSWRVLVLPYIEESKLHAEYDFAEPWDGPNNRQLAGRMPRIYAFHGTERLGNSVTNYVAVVGDGTAWPGSETVAMADVTDATSATILIAENLGARIGWMEPRDLTLTDMDLRLNTPGGIGSKYDAPAVAMLDGSVQRLGLTIRPDTLRALLTIRGGEPLTAGEGGWEVLADGRQRPPRRP